MITDLLLAIGLPVLQMTLGKYDFLLWLFFRWRGLTWFPFAPSEYIVSGHRFNIYEDFGCGPATWNTHLAYVLVYFWPLILGVVSATYGCELPSHSLPLR